LNRSTRQALVEAQFEFARWQAIPHLHARQIMSGLNLSMLAALLGAAYALPNLYGSANPDQFGALLKKFPRNLAVGIVLMLLGTAWFLYYVHIERNAEFAAMKPFLMTGFALAGIGACIYLQDFLAVRGLAVTMLLLAKLMLDAQRWHESQWRLVIAVWAYLMIVLGIWFTISPWRCRNWIAWNTASLQRLRWLSGVRAAFGVLVVVLALTAFR
jgi:hypothetical protein